MLLSFHRNRRDYFTLSGELAYSGKNADSSKRKSKKQAEFIAAASHELRSPLAVIQASASAVRASPENADQMLSNIEKECTRMGNLIKDLLVLAASDSRKWQLTLETYDSDTLLLDVYETFEPVCRHKNIRLNLLLPDTELPHVRCDKNRVIQILTILLDNAIAYTAPDETIDLQISSKKKKSVIRSPITGKGFPTRKKTGFLTASIKAINPEKKKNISGLDFPLPENLPNCKKVL